MQILYSIRLIPRDAYQFPFLTYIVKDPFVGIGFGSIWCILYRFPVKDIGYTAILLPSGGVYICQKGKSLLKRTEKPL